MKGTQTTTEALWQKPAKKMLEDVIREGAQRMLQAAIEMEVAEHIQRLSGATDAAGHRLVVRNGWKRRLREAFRAVRGQLPAGQDYVVVVRAAEIPHGVGGASATEAWLVGLAHRIVSRPGYRTATLPAVRATKPRRR